MGKAKVYRLRKGRDTVIALKTCSILLKRLDNSEISIEEIESTNLESPTETGSSLEPATVSNQEFSKP